MGDVSWYGYFATATVRWDARSRIYRDRARLAMKRKPYIWTWREFLGWPLVWIALGGVGCSLLLRWVF